MTDLCADFLLNQYVECILCMNYVDRMGECLMVDYVQSERLDDSNTNLVSNHIDLKIRIIRITCFGVPLV